MGKQERWKKRQEQTFPRGIELNERYYKWLAENNYIDKGAYADGSKDGKIVLTTGGQKYFDRAVERQRAADELINFDLLDANEYGKGKVIFTTEGKKYIDPKEYRKGNIVFTKQGQKRLRELRKVWKQEVLSTLYGVMDDTAEQLLMTTAFVAAGRAEDVRHHMECLKEVVKVVNPQSKV